MDTSSVDFGTFSKVNLWSKAGIPTPEISLITYSVRSQAWVSQKTPVFIVPTISWEPSTHRQSGGTHEGEEEDELENEELDEQEDEKLDELQLELQELEKEELEQELEDEKLLDEHDDEHELELEKLELQDEEEHEEKLLELEHDEDEQLEELEELGVLSAKPISQAVSCGLVIPAFEPPIVPSLISSSKAKTPSAERLVPWFLAPASEYCKCQSSAAAFQNEKVWFMRLFAPGAVASPLALFVVPVSNVPSKSFVPFPSARQFLVIALPEDCSKPSSPLFIALQL